MAGPRRAIGGLQAPASGDAIGRQTDAGKPFTRESHCGTSCRAAIRPDARLPNGDLRCRRGGGCCLRGTECPAGRARPRPRSRRSTPISRAGSVWWSTNSRERHFPDRPVSQPRSMRSAKAVTAVSNLFPPRFPGTCEACMSPRRLARGSVETEKERPLAGRPSSGPRSSRSGVRLWRRVLETALTSGTHAVQRFFRSPTACVPLVSGRHRVKERSLQSTAEKMAENEPESRRNASNPVP